MANLIDFTDEQLSNALHFIEGHEDSLEGAEARAWAQVKQMILRTAQQQKELEA